jgi:hypothetical protein
LGGEDLVLIGVAILAAPETGGVSLTVPFGKKIADLLPYFSKTGLGKSVLSKGSEFIKKITAQITQQNKLFPIKSVYNSTPIGGKGKQFTSGNYNVSSKIDGIPYKKHALDEMQEEGIFPTVVKSIIRNTKSMKGKKPDTIAYYCKENNVTVIQNHITKYIITVTRGRIKQ